MTFIERTIRNYPYTRINQKQAHRVIWEHHYGAIPKGQLIHHINGDKADNRIENLFCCSTQEHKRIHSYKYHKINGEWQKYCIDCKEILQLSNYYILDKRRDPPQTHVICKRCLVIRNAKNKEKRIKRKHDNLSTEG